MQTQRHLTRTASRVIQADPFAFFVAAASIAYVQTQTGWWLNSGAGVASTVLAMALLTVLLRRGGTTSLWPRAAIVWGGAMTGLMATLVFNGPGNLWPLVIALSVVLTALAAAIGAVASASWL